jgi:hypothetical protein
VVEEPERHSRTAQPAIVPKADHVRVRAHALPIEPLRVRRCHLGVVLDNRDSGLDDILRRWTFEDPYWRCIDNGQLAEQSGSAGYEQ